MIRKEFYKGGYGGWELKVGWSWGGGDEYVGREFFCSNRNSGLMVLLVNNIS